MRLDGPLWLPTALGTVGPPDLLATLLYGDSISYRPLLSVHRTRANADTTPPELTRLWSNRSALERAGLFSKLSIAAVDNRNSDEDDFVGATLYDSHHNCIGYIVVQLDWRDRRWAKLRLLWLDAPGERTYSRRLSSAWRNIYRMLTDRGVLAVVASEASLDNRLIPSLRSIAGFQPAVTILSTMGVAEADSLISLARWSANVRADLVESFSLEGCWPSADDHAARAEAMRLLTLRITSDLDTPPDTDGTRRSPPRNGYVRLSGTIDLVGCCGWQASVEGSDQMSGDAEAETNSALASLLRWLSVAELAS